MSVGAVAPQAPEQWHSLHVHYGTDVRPLLVECVRPLVATLRSRGLLAGYYFVNDWIEGPHVRLHLCPARAADTAEVLEWAETELDRFLAHRPVLHRPEPPLPYTALLALAPERRAAYPGDRVPTQVPNTIHHRRHDPEYAVHGGPEGAAVARWHFERSSDLALELLAGPGRPEAGDLTLIAMSAVLRTLPAMRVFASRMHRYWRGALSDAPEPAEAEIVGLAARIPLLSSRSPAHAAWADHCAELRTRLARATLTTPPAALLARFAGRTINRLGLTPLDEARLFHTVHHALRSTTDLAVVPG